MIQPSLPISNHSILVRTEPPQYGYRTSSGSPSVTPMFIGEHILDATAKKWYKSAGATSADWVALN